MKRKARLLPLTFLALAFPAFAANQIQNAQFTTDVTSGGWLAGLWGATWVGTEGNTAPGAARVDATSASGSIGAAGITQCTTAAPGTYDFGGAFKIEPASTQTGGARLRVTWFNGPSCTGSPTIGDSIDPTNAAGWQPLAVNNTTAPGGTVSVMIELIQSVDGAGTFTAYWDDIYFGPDPTALSVTLQKFEVD